MSFVFDRNDRSGFGMFSKAGRYTSEKHVIFQKRDEILYDQRKIFKVSSIPLMSTKALKASTNEPPLPLDEKKEEELPQKKKQKGQKETAGKPEPLHEVKDKYPTVKNDFPSFGFYHPRYTQVFERQPMLVNYKRELTKTKALPKEETPGRPLDEELMESIHERPRPRTVVPTSMEKQLPRPDFLSHQNDPHELRFVSFEYPEVFSKTKKSPFFLISKTSGRQDRNMYKKVEHLSLIHI
eukprot:TRINITY_DN6593_c0_g1_i3.p1 TRINITY_DN6593_c0_g1~~TRINITY_DN6593_c0_g1_i3.p1  ORF type:complete len:239 (-),score=51.43 TRINITY_DN6593_c0_g1_i3:60-776(-)